jgi:hypothetical protein
MLYVEELVLSYENADFCLGDTISVEANDGVLFEYQWNTGSVEQQIEVISTGIYAVEVIDYNGCVFRDSVALTTHQPVVNLGSDKALCAGDSKVLDAGFSEVSYLWSTSETSQTITIETEGEYSVILTDTFECTNSDTVIVTVNDLPTVDLGADQTIGDNETVTLDAGSFSAYEWSTSETTQSIAVDGAEIGAGTFTYSVVVTDGNSCSNSDSVYIEVVEHESSLNDMSEELSIHVYPNPASDVTTFGFNTTAEEINIYILSIDNREMYKEQLFNVQKSTELSVDISGFAAGVYFVITEIDGEQKSQKLIIE